MMLEPKVCAIVPTRNRKDKTIRFLNNFSRQTYKNLDTVIVDANSTDGTSDEIARIFPGLKVIHVDDNSYWTASTNRGVEFALGKKYDYILTINDDSHVEPDYVLHMMEIALKYETSILGSRIDYMVRPDLIWSIGAYSTWGSSRIMQLRYNLQWAGELPSDILSKEIIEVEALPGNGVLIHRAVFEKIGLYNEIFLPHYHSDSEFIMRAIKNKVNVYASTSVVVYNDCELECLDFRVTSFKGIYLAYFRKKSHLFILPILYTIIIYCPFGKKLLTLVSVFLFPLLKPIKEKLLVRTRVRKVIRYSVKKAMAIGFHVKNLVQEKRRVI